VPLDEVGLDRGALTPPLTLPTDAATKTNGAPARREEGNE
jgi:hypothetical protein